MSRSLPDLPAGARVRVMDTRLAQHHGISGAIGTVIPITDPDVAARGDAVAIELLTGLRAYEAVVVPISTVSRHDGACYWCPHAQPMNDRDMVWCGLHGRHNASGGTCGSRTRELGL